MIALSMDEDHVHHAVSVVGVFGDRIKVPVVVVVFVIG